MANYEVKNLQIRLKGSADEVNKSLTETQSRLLKVSVNSSKVRQEWKQLINVGLSLNNVLKKINETGAKTANILQLITGLKTNNLTSQFRETHKSIGKTVSGVKTLETALKRLKTPNMQDKTLTETTPTASKKKNNQPIFDNFSLGSMISGMQSKLMLLNTMKNALNFEGSFRYASDYLENFNLLSVAFDENTNKALRFQNSLEGILGIDASKSIRYQGFIKNLGESLGMATQQSDLLSENLTKLVYDVSSLYNISIEDAYTKITSGIVGQTKPLRSLGIDVTQQTLQPILKELGINILVKDLTQAQKVMLRYISIMRQSGNAQGDFARTINAPANQMRLLQESIAITGRWIQTVFLGAVTKVLPYLTGFAQVVGIVAKSIATLFGFKLNDFKGVSTKTLVDMESLGLITDDASKKIGGATSKAKELKKELLSFDMINNINSQKNSGIGGVGGISGGLGSLSNENITKKLQDAMKSYDNLMGEVNNKATKISSNILEWLGFSKHINSETGEINWKLDKLTWGNFLIGGALAIKGISAVSKVLGFLGNNVVGVSTGLSGLKTMLFGGQVATTAMTTATTGTVAKVGLFQKALGGLKGLLLLMPTPLKVVVGVIAALGTALAIYKVVEWNNKFNMFNGISKETTKNLKPLVEKMQELSKINFTNLHGVEILSDNAIANTKKKIADLYQEINKYKDEYIAKEETRIEKEKQIGKISQERAEEEKQRLKTLLEYNDVAIQKMIFDYEKLQEEVNKKYKGIAPPEIQAQLKTKADTINAIMREMWINMGKNADEFKPIIQQAIGGIIDNSDVEQIKNSLADLYGTVSETLIKLRNSEMEHLEKQYQLGEITVEEYQKRQKAIIAHYSQIKNYVETGNNEVLAIYNKAFKESRELTIEERGKIEAIYQNSLSVILNNVSISEEEKMRLIENFNKVTLNNLDKNIEEEKKRIKAGYDNKINALRNQHNTIVAEIEKNNARIFELEDKYNTDFLTEEEEHEIQLLRLKQNSYHEQLKALSRSIELQESERDKTLRKADERNNIFKANLEKHMYEHNEIILRKLKETGRFTDEELNKISNSILKIPTTTADAMRMMMDGTVEKVKSAQRALQKYFNDNKLRVQFSHTGLKIVPANTQRGGMTIEQYHTGGFVDYGDMFIANERGAELVGKIGNKTAVVNQTQIITAVSQGVSSAVQEVINRNRGNKATAPINLVVKLGDETLEKTVIKGLNNAMNKGYEF